MQLVYETVRVVHLVAGAVGLLLVPVPLLRKKGGTTHKRIGKLFVAAMATAGYTGLGMAFAWLVSPLAFRPGASPSDVAGIRAGGLFLGTIALITLSAIHMLVRAPARKRETTPAPSRIDRGLPLATVIAGVGTLATGLVLGRGLLIAFGALAIASGTGDLRVVMRRLPSRMAWWYQHMRAAMTAVIAALTAFLVFGGRRWLVDVVPQNLSWVLWIAPAFVLVPLTELWAARFRRRFGERKA